MEQQEQVSLRDPLEPTSSSKAATHLPEQQQARAISIFEGMLQQ